MDMRMYGLYKTAMQLEYAKQHALVNWSWVMDDPTILAEVLEKCEPVKSWNDSYIFMSIQYAFFKAYLAIDQEEKAENVIKPLFDISDWFAVAQNNLRKLDMDYIKESIEHNEMLAPSDLDRIVFGKKSLDTQFAATYMNKSAVVIARPYFRGYRRYSCQAMFEQSARDSGDTGTFWIEDTEINTGPDLGQLSDTIKGLDYDIIRTENPNLIDYVRFRWKIHRLGQEQENQLWMNQLMDNIR